MKMPMTITDLTRMQDDRVCVAGYLQDLTCIRPVLKADALHQWWLSSGGHTVVRPFAVVEFDVLYGVQKGVLSPEQRQDLLAKLDDGHVEAIFGATIHHDEGWYVMAGEGTRSLGTIRPAQIESVWYAAREEARWDYRLAFADGAGRQYRLAVTDLAFRLCLDYLRDRKGMSAGNIVLLVEKVLQQRAVFLRIGLSRGWHKHPDHCYLQVTGVYSFPDYLQGRCFADLAPHEEVAAVPDAPRDPLPF